MEKDELIDILTQAIKSLADETVVDVADISSGVIYDVLQVLNNDPGGFNIASGAKQQLLRSRALISSLVKIDSDVSVKHEASAIISDLVKTGVIPPYKGGRGSNPQQWVMENVVPHLPESMRPLAFDQSIYSSAIPNLYKIIRVWRATGSRHVEKFYSSR